MEVSGCCMFYPNHSIYFLDHFIADAQGKTSTLFVLASLFFFDPFDFLC
jgi:hypothetical protein